jgi:hypothetical protein
MLNDVRSWFEVYGQRVSAILLCSNRHALERWDGGYVSIILKKQARKKKVNYNMFLHYGASGHWLWPSAGRFRVCFWQLTHYRRTYVALLQDMVIALFKGKYV